MELREITETLNDLIKVSNDSVEGFTACAENASVTLPELRTLLLERTYACGLASDALSALVRDLGETPATGTTVDGALQHAWLNVQAGILPKDDGDVLELIERGEDVAMLAYKRALDKDLPIAVLSVVEQQYRAILDTRAVIRHMRDKYRLMRP